MKKTLILSLFIGIASFLLAGSQKPAGKIPAGPAGAGRFIRMSRKATR